MLIRGAYRSHRRWSSELLLAVQGPGLAQGLGLPLCSFRRIHLLREQEDAAHVAVPPYSEDFIGSASFVWS